MEEDQSESLRAPQPDSAEPDTNQETPNPALQTTPQPDTANNAQPELDSIQDTAEVGLQNARVQDEAVPQPDLQQLAQQAASAVDQANGDVKGEHVEVLMKTSIDITSNELDVPLQHKSERYLALPAPESIAGDSATAEAGSQDVKPHPDLDYSLPLSNDNTMFGNGEPYSDGSFEVSQRDIEPSLAESEERQIQAYAKLEFDDGEFYMMTYAVELGRDVHAARQAYERDLDLRDGTSSKSRKHSPSSGGGASISSDRIKQEDGNMLANGAVSESGGIVADHHGSESGKKTRRKKSRSSSTSSRHLSWKSSMQFPVSRVDYNQLATDGLMTHSGMNGYGPELMPSPDTVPLIPIHPPQVMDGAGAHKSISRKHIKIAFNFDKHLFEVEVLGRNGCYVNDVFAYPEDVVELQNGSVLQIGGVGVRFVLPDVPEGATGAELGESFDPLSGGKMSFDMAASNEEDVEDGEEQGEEHGVEDEDESEPEMVKTRAKAKKKSEPGPSPTRRKGPGRPPKNGIISKREQALQAKEAREEAKSGGRKMPSTIDGRGKGKTAKEVKKEKQEENLQPNGKRKYTKRKRAGGLDDQRGVRESTEQTDSAPPEQALAVALPLKPAKEKKPPKPPRSPSPVFDESKMTPEQLAKPQSSYVILIHEALTSSKTGAMSLPQIYRAIERRYPFYKLRVQTQGWQSSVRHNLSQHPAFKKIERDGKGWMWGLVPEISIEKEKKRRPSPPAQSQQQYYPRGPPMMQYPHPYPGMPPPNGHMPPAPYGMRPSMPMPYPPPPYGRPPPPMPLVNAQSESTYQSPYQSTPPPAPEPSQRPQQLSNTNSYVGPYAPSQPPKPQPSNPNGAPSAHQQQTQLSPAMNGASNNNGNQEVAQAMARFKSSLISTMDDKDYAEKLVSSAINRTLGIQNKSSLPGEEDPQEKSIMTAFSNMLGDLSKKNMETKPQASPASVPLPSKSDKAPAGENGSAFGETSASKAADIAAKNALANGEPTPSKNGEPDEPRRGTKRPLENRDGDEAGDTEQPEAKRVAVTAD